MTDRSCPFIQGKEISDLKTSAHALRNKKTAIDVAGM
jgi:hypothetical protein